VKEDLKMGGTLESMVQGIVDKKMAMNDLKKGIESDTVNLMAELIRRDMTEMLSINWTRLHRLTCTVSVEERIKYGA
jgi:hypothetical protein